MIAATDEYREESNPVREWAEECCIEDADARTLFKDLYASYLEWTTEQRIKLPLKRRRFGDLLAAAGYPRDTISGNKAVHRGLRLTAEPPAI